MTQDESAAKDAQGCARVGFGLLLGFAAIEGGIVAIAVSLHYLLGRGGLTPEAVIGALTGVVLVFAGPQFWFAAARARQRVTWRQAAAAFPDLLLAGWFILGWAAPQVRGARAAGTLVGVMAMEFIIIHASVTMVALPEKMARMPEGPWWRTPHGARAGLLLLYSLFAAGFSLAFSSWWLFAGFWALFAIKFMGDWLTPAAHAEERAQRHMARWGTSAFFYLLLAFGSIFIPVPRLGATSASRGGGLWETHPEQAVMMGALYFALLGFCELYGGFNRVRAAAPPPSAAA